LKIGCSGIKNCNTFLEAPSIINENVKNVLLVLVALFNIVPNSCYVECRFAERRGAKSRCQLNFLVTLRVLDTTETRLARFLISVEQEHPLSTLFYTLDELKIRPFVFLQ